MKYLTVLFFACLVSAQFKVPDMEEKKVDYWMEFMKKDITEALKITPNNKVAKNVIIFVGDGMGIPASTAGRIHKGQNKGFSGEEESLVWEKFPHIALIKTYNLDKQVPDSAATATAMFTGSKVNYFTVGCAPNVIMEDYKTALDESNWLPSFIQWGQEAGKDSGIVTTTRVTHATPAATYAHTSQRIWECDANMNETVRSSNTKDIARQMIEDSPGNKINVILGGGRSVFGAALPDDEIKCEREDARDLTQEWKTEKENNGSSAEYVTNTEELLAVDPENTDFILGLFSGSHTPFEAERDTSSTGSPSLQQMTETAIKRLQRNENGFVLMVEGGRIDHALHMSRPYLATEEISALDQTVEAVLGMVDLEETLVIVCADHSHVMTINGYPVRGNDILGKTSYAYSEDKLPYPTLMFTAGPGFEGTFTWNGTHVVRKDITDVDTTSPDWVSPAIVQTTGNYNAFHGGEDIGLYAAGPMSHLFHRVHEQAYVAHVMGYASCIGPYAEDCNRNERETTKPISKFSRKNM